jgi:hypothetical protein
MVAQFTQRDEKFQDNYDVSGGLNLRGGTTVIASANGVVRYVISKPLESEKFSAQKNAEARMRRERQEAFVRELDQADMNLTWSNYGYFRNRIARSLNSKRFTEHLENNYAARRPCFHTNVQHRLWRLLSAHVPRT